MKKLSKKEIEALVKGFVLGKIENVYGKAELLFYDLEEEYNIHIKLENAMNSQKIIVEEEPIKVIIMTTFDDSAEQNYCGQKCTTNQDDIFSEFLLKRDTKKEKLNKYKVYAERIESSLYDCGSSKR